MARFEALWKVFFALFAFGLLALSVKQGIAIAEHDVAGWLRGDGPFQTEWEVRAVVGLLLVGLPALVVAVFVRSGEAIFQRLRERRWERAARRSHDADEPRP